MSYLNELGPRALLTSALALLAACPPTVDAAGRRGKENATPTTSGAALDRVHESALAAAKADRLPEAVATMARLVNERPDTLKFRYDYIALLHWNGQHKEAILEGSRIDLGKAPSYVLEALARSASTVGRNEDALKLYNAVIRREPAREEALVPKVWLFNDQERWEDARKAGADATRALPKSDDAWLAYAYALRHGGDLAQALMAYMRAADLAPDNKDARLGQVLTLEALGAPHLANEILRKHPGLVDPDDQIRLQQQKAAHTLGWGPADPDLRNLRYRNTDLALQHMEDNLKLIQAQGRKDTPAWQEQLFDKIVALNARRKHEETVRLYEDLVQRKITLPDYARGAAAGSYAALHKPAQALALFDELLKEQPTDFDWRIGRFYALSDLERMDEAFAAIDAIASDVNAQPDPTTWRGRRSKPHLVEALTTQAMSRAYAEQLAAANRMLDEVIRKHPYSPSVQTSQGFVKAWRGHPRAAEQDFNGALAVDPRNRDAAIGRIDALATTGRLKEARRALQALEADDPDHERVREASRRQDVRDMPEVNLSLVRNADRNGRGLIAEAYVYSPPLDDYLRLYGHLRNTNGRVFDDKVHDFRAGLGVEFTAHNVSGSVEAQRVGYRRETAGIGRLNVDLSDQWHWRSGFESRASDIAYQAMRAGIGARSVNTGLTWRQDERRALSVDMRRMHYTDGNQRSETSANWHELWVAGPRYRVSTDARIGTSRNTKTDAVYFNPASDRSLGVESLVEWLGFRDYNRSLWHAVGLNLGSYAQEGFSAKPTMGLKYEMRYRMDDQTELAGGYGINRRTYDGNYTTLHNVFLNFNRRF